MVAGRDVEILANQLKVSNRTHRRARRERRTKNNLNCITLRSLRLILLAGQEAPAYDSSVEVSPVRSVFSVMVRGSTNWIK